jgi:hypothetical protein
MQTAVVCFGPGGSSQSPTICGAEGLDGYPAPSPGAGGWKAMERGVDGFGRTSGEKSTKGHRRLKVQS